MEQLIKLGFDQFHPDCFGWVACCILLGTNIDKISPNPEHILVKYTYTLLLKPSNWFTTHNGIVNFSEILGIQFLKPTIEYS